MLSSEPRREKTGFLHMRKQRRKSASRLTAKLISAFVFAKKIVQSLYFLSPKFQASSHLLYLYSLVCVGPRWKPRKSVFSQRGPSSLLRKLYEHGDVHEMVDSDLILRIHKMSHVGRKPVVEVSAQVRHKPGCSATEDGWRLEISYLRSGRIVLSV